MTFGSLFSGVGGFDLALERVGMQCLWQVELDPKCCALLESRWPTVERHADVRTVGTALARVDLICGGFPCQDLSVAGRRAGLAGKRSGLWFEFHRIVECARPRWVLIENVPGLLSSAAGADFAALLRGLVELGYGVAWRILDAQFAGLAQRRDRVFIVGSLGGGSSAPVLFEPASVRWDPPPRRTSRPGSTAPPVSRALSRVSGGDDPGANKGAPVIPALVNHNRPGRTQDGRVVLANTLGQESEARTRIDGTLVRAPHGHHGYGSPRGDGTDPLVSDTLRVGGRDRGAGSSADNTPIVAAPLRSNMRNNSDAGTEARALIPDTADPVLANEGGTYTHEGNGFRLHNVVPDIAWALQERDAKGPDSDTKDGHLIVASLNENGRGEVLAGEVTRALAGPGGKPGQGYAAATTSSGVRRLTPRECERLQGFPDDWTAAFSDSTRYRMLGNAVPVPVVEWIGRRILSHSGPEGR